MDGWKQEGLVQQSLPAFFTLCEEGKDTVSQTTKWFCIGLAREEDMSAQCLGRDEGV